MSGWLTWQVVDSAFPTGAFAHSSGLEAAWQHGEVEGPAALDRFVRAAVLQTGHAVLPLLNDAYREPERVAELDALADAFLVNVVANRASRVQGRTLVATAARVVPSDSLTALQRTLPQICAHVAPLSGVVFRLLGLPLETAQRVSLFSAARGVLAAAVRLGLAGSYEAQRMQHQTGQWLHVVADRCRALTCEDLVQTAPVIDILQARHDRLYSRLFQS
jgi:urease accessory protein